MIYYHIILRISPDCESVSVSSLLTSSIISFSKQFIKISLGLFTVNFMTELLKENIQYQYKYFSLVRILHMDITLSYC